MPLSRAEAQGALDDLSTAERASAKAYGYRHASQHMFVWGTIWIVGYGLTYARPQWDVAWPALALLGTIASLWIGRASKPAGVRYDWRYLGTALAVLGFIIALFVIMPPQSSLQISAFFPILVALFYSLIGIWTRGARMLIAGIAVAALTLGGFFLLPQYFLLWMAVVGGGAVILGGFWLRSV